jgi:hypothetical protein
MQDFGKYISIVVILVYFSLGFSMLFTHFFDDALQKEIRILGAVFFLLYGSYRLARLFKKKPNNTQEEEEVQQ